MTAQSIVDDTFDSTLDWLADSKPGRIVAISVIGPAVIGIAMLGCAALFGAFNVAGASLSLWAPMKIALFSILLSFGLTFLYVAAGFGLFARRHLQATIVQFRSARR